MTVRLGCQRNGRVGRCHPIGFVCAVSGAPEAQVLRSLRRDELPEEPGLDPGAARRRMFHAKYRVLLIVHRQ